MSRVPIIIVCFNNYKYVENTVKQFININKDLEKDIIILDNASTCQKTRKYLLDTKCKVVLNTENKGPWLSSWQNQELYELLPEQFIVTDPDLQFNPNLPSNFIEILLHFSNKFNAHKVGFALDISDGDKMIHLHYAEPATQYNPVKYQTDSGFWENKIEDDNYELYRAGIDTTFALIKKTGDWNINIRIAGDFTCKHIPWYIDNPVYDVYENYEMASYNSKGISSFGSILTKFINYYYIKVNKNDIYFFIKNTDDDPNLVFWTNHFPSWEHETFNVFDKFLSKDKIFIDIGSWIGTTGIYGCRKSKHVFLVEADPKALVSLENNCKNNCDNYTIIDSAIYKDDNIDMKFGKNIHLANSRINDSTSHIYLDGDASDEFYNTKTITIKSIIENNNIDYNDISLIKVDIEGGEEHIMNDLFDVYNKHNIPMYISFHYSWWKDKNLDRFPFLSDQNKEAIINNPFISLLFDKK